MDLHIQVSGEGADLLASQAAEHGKTIGEWVEKLARERAEDHDKNRRERRRAAAAELLKLQREVAPDPDGLTVLDYLRIGRR